MAGIALAMAGMLAPLRATRSESVFSKILFHFHILHNKKGVSPSPLKLGINMLPPAYNSIRAKMLCSNAQKLEAGMQTKRKIRRCGAWVTGFIITVLFCVGCSVEQTNRTKISDLDYAIVAENEIPEELLADIEEKKAADFKMIYKDDAFLYIVRGYGEQETGGYSICMQEVYLTSNAIIFDTELIGPRKGETISKSPSYPYIVVKVELRDENVVFE